MLRAGRSLDRFSAKTKRAHTNIGLMADRLKLIAGTGVVFGAVYGFARLVANVERFNQAMQESTAIMRGLTDHMRGEMRQAALEMAKTVRFSAEELARAFYFLTSAGLSTSQTLQALPAVARFAQAGMFDVARATELLTDAQSALGMKMKDASKNYVNMVKVSDALIRVTQLADATTEQFATALTNRAAAAMRMYNIPLAEGVAMLAVFANQNLKAEIGGRAFDIVLRDLSVKATQNAAAFKAAGIAVFDAAGNFNFLPDIIADLERAYAGLSVQQIKQLQLMLGFQQRSITFQNSLIGMSEQMRDYTESMEAMGGATQDVADNQLTDFTKAWERLKGVVMDVAEGMQQPIDDLATSIQYVVDLLEGFPDATEKARRKVTGDKGWFNQSRGVVTGGAALGVEAFGTISGVLANALEGAAGFEWFFRTLQEELHFASDAMLDFADEMSGLDTSSQRIWQNLAGNVEVGTTAIGKSLTASLRPIDAWRREIDKIEALMGDMGLKATQLGAQDMFRNAEDRFAALTGPRQRSQEHLDQVRKVNAAMAAAKMGPALSPEEIVAQTAAETKRMSGMVRSAKTWANEIRNPFEILIESLDRLKMVASEIDLSKFGNVKNLQRLRDMQRGEFKASIGIQEGPGDILKQQREQINQAVAAGTFSPDEAFDMRKELTEKFIEQQGGMKLDVLAERWFTQTRQPDEIFEAKLEEIKALRIAGAFTEFAGSKAAGTELYRRAIGTATKKFAPKPGASVSGFISSSQTGGQAGANVLSAASTVQAKELKEMEKQTKLLEQLLREQQAGGMRA